MSAFSPRAWALSGGLAVLAGLTQAVALADPLGGRPHWWLQMLGLGALAALLAKVQPVPWVWRAWRRRGRASQPLAWGVSIQSSAQPGHSSGAADAARPLFSSAARASPPVTQTACAPMSSRRRAWRAAAAMPRGRSGPLSPHRRAASAALGVMSVARGTSSSQ